MYKKLIQNKKNIVLKTFLKQQTNYKFWVWIKNTSIWYGHFKIFFFYFYKKINFVVREKQKSRGSKLKVWWSSSLFKKT
jgi:hypothetical protein